jgi:hypothetical protein
MTRFTEYLFISHGHIDNQPLTPDAFNPSSGQNLWGLRLLGRARNSNQVCLSLIGLSLCELYDILAGDNDLSLYSAAGFPYLFKLCND